MVLTMKSARAEDVHLTKRALVAILALNQDVPETNGEVWLLTTEITERLVHCGVDSSLELIFVAEAIEKYNQKTINLEKRSYKGQTYFRPSMISGDHHWISAKQRHL